MRTDHWLQVYGPRQPSTGAYAIVTGVFTQQQLEGSLLPVEGDGSHYRDFVHVHDIVRGLIVGMQSNVSGDSINLGTGETMSVKELADMVSPNQSQVAERPFDLIGTLADTCKAKNVSIGRQNTACGRRCPSCCRQQVSSHLQYWQSPMASQSEAATRQPRTAPAGFTRTDYQFLDSIAVMCIK